VFEVFDPVSSPRRGWTGRDSCSNGGGYGEVLCEESLAGGRGSEEVDFFMRIASAPMTGAQIVGEISVIARLLIANGINEVIVYSGWGSGLSVDELWRPRRMNPGDLPDFLRTGIEAGVFRPGNSDLFIEDEAKSFEFLLCHESDIHLTTGIQSLMEQTAQHWAEIGYSRSVTEGNSS
jgi:hypothetical protein